MNIIINGEPHTFADGLSADRLIDELKLGGKRVAMEVNGDILPKSAYANHEFREGDKIEIIHAVGGG